MTKGSDRAQAVCALRFFFNKRLLKESYDYQHVIAEIDKYLLPQTEAPAQGTGTKTVALGQTPEQVEAILGRIVDLGQKKVYVYKDMKIVFVDSKVADVQ